MTHLKPRQDLLFIIFCIGLILGINSQSLTYSGPNSFSISEASFLNNSLVTTLERTPTGMAFGDNGNKMYLIGSQSDFVAQFTLNTAYDYSSRGPLEEAFRVFSEETSPQDVEFNDTGTRMYIVGNTGDDITEYSLSTAWDVSTATFTDTFDARTAIENLLGSTNGDLLVGMDFNDDGSKLYIADRRSDDVFEFDLSTNYDVSTAGAVVNNMPITGESNVRDISFNDDGTELYVIGNQGDDVNTFPLSIAYDLSSVGSSTNHTLPGSPDNTPQAIILDDAGTTFWVAGSTDDELKEYTLSSAFDFSSTITFITSYPFPTRELAPRGLVFNNDGTKLFVACDQTNVVSELSLNIPYDISTGVFDGVLFINSEESAVRGLAFNNAGTTLYIIGANGDEINGYDLSVAYDLNSTITTTSGSPFSIVNEDSSPTDIFFNNDGTKLYVLGNDGNDLNQYSLSPAYDISDATAANLDIAFPLNNVSGLVIDSAPQGMAFNSDGSKLYIAGNQGNDINEISLSANFDLSTGTIINTATFSIAAEESTITDVIFSADGSRFFITGTNGDDMNQYQTKGFLRETPINNGTIDVSNPLVITLTGDTFADADTDDLLDLTTEFTITNLPSGLNPIFTLSNGDTVATLTFSGTATNNDSSDDVTNLIFNFTDAAFRSSNASDVDLAVGHTNVLGVDFNYCIDEIVYESGSWRGGNNSGVPDDSPTDLVKGINVRENVTITADVNCDCLFVEPGITLTVADGIKLEVTNIVQSEGDIRLNGEAQLLQTFSGIKNESGGGDLTIDQTSATTNIYQSGYWTSPVTTNGSTFTISGAMKDGTTSTPQDINFTNSSIYDGDGTTSPITVSGRWLAKLDNALTWTVPLDPDTQTFNPGVGYNMKGTGGSDGSSTQNYSFVGTPNAGDYSLSIDDVRLYLIGNPYPSALDGNDFITDNSDAIGGTLYFYESGTEMSHSTDDYDGGYATYNGITGVPFNMGKTPGRYIPVGQAFFVVRDVSNSLGTGTVGSSENINFTNSQRNFELEGANSVVFSREQEDRNNDKILKLGLDFEVTTTRSYHRQIAVGFVGATREYENGLDSPMFGNEASDFFFSVDNRNDAFAIIGIEDFSTEIEIPLTVKSDADRLMTFSVDENIGLVGQKIYLIDYQELQYYEIQENPKEILVSTGEYTDRFAVTFKIPESLSQENPELINLKVYHDYLNEVIVIDSSQLIFSNVEVFDIIGKRIFEYDNKERQSKLEISTRTFKPGIYLIRTKTNKGILNKKIIID